MRPDLAKCIIERPRRGHGSRNMKIRHFGRFVQTEDGIEYEGLTRIPTSRKAALLYEHDCKDPTDCLGPLHKYLLSSCGRLWDDVYSEIAYHIGRFSHREGLRHIIDQHLNVETNTYRGVDGNVYSCNGYGVSRVGYGYRPWEFYVEPETGILRKSPRKKFIGYPPDAIEVISITKDKEDYRKIDGIWYYIEFSRVEWWDWRGAHHDEHILKKKQLNRKELKLLEISNDTDKYAPHGKKRKEKPMDKDQIVLEVEIEELEPKVAPECQGGDQTDPGGFL